MADTGSTELIIATISSWQEQLLQLDGRNRLLYLKPAGSGVVPIKTDSIDEFLDRLEEKKGGLKFPYAEKRGPRPSGRWGRADPIPMPEDSDRGGPGNEPLVVAGDIEVDADVLRLQGTLTLLRKKDREFTDEQGVNVLFLGAGLLDWVDEKDQAAVAPLVLIPCDLDRASVRDHFYLRREDDDASDNATLRYKLGTLGVQLPEFDGESAVEEYLQQVERTLPVRLGWGVRRELVLAIFQYSKIAMWKDLEALKVEVKAGRAIHPLVGALAGGSNGGAGATQPVEREWFDAPPQALAGGRLDEAVDPEAWPLVMPADFSQLQAIGAAAGGDHLVIHGPPGTGKSQTIANLIALFLARGKTVLFVSEKTAALDVVKRRLDQCGLGQFALDLHSERGKKANVYRQFKEAIDAQQHVPVSGFDYESLRAQRAELNRAVRSLHQKRPPLDRTVFQVQGQFARVFRVPAAEFQVRDPLKRTNSDFEAVRLAARDVANRKEEFRAHFTGRWVALRRASSYPLDFATTLRAEIQTARAALLPASEVAADLPSTLGISAVGSLNDLRGAVRVVEMLLKRPPGVPAKWLSPGVAKELLQSVAKLRADTGHRGTALAEIGRYQRSAEERLNYHAFADRFAAISLPAAAADRTLGENWKATVLTRAPAMAAACREFRLAAADATAAAEAARARLGLTQPVTPSLADLCDRLLKEVAELTPVPAEWLGPGSGGRALAPVLKAGRTLAAAVTTAETELFARWSESLLGLATTDLLARFRTGHQSAFKRLFGSAYRRDKAALAGLIRGDMRFSLAEATSGIERALHLQELRAEWERYAAQNRPILGPLYAGRDTDWDALDDRYSRFQSLLQACPSARVHEWLLTPGAPEEARQLRQTLASAVARHRRIVESLGTPLRDHEPFDAMLADVEALQQPLDELGRLAAELAPSLAGIPPSLSELHQFLGAGVAVQHIEADFLRRGPALREDLGETFRGLATDWDTLSAAIAWANELTLHAGRPTARLVEHVLRPWERAEYTALRDRLLASIREVEAAHLQLDVRFDPARAGGAARDDTLLSAQIDWCDDRAANASSVTGWIQYRQVCDALDGLVGAEVADAVRHATGDPEQIVDVVMRRYWQSWLEAVYAEEPRLGGLTSGGQDALIRDFRELDQRLPRAAALDVRRAVMAGHPYHVRTLTNGGELGVLQSQVNKKRGQIPVRKLLRRVPSVALRLKPCFMMSPLAVSQHLERAELASERIMFDVVIFDEASQVFPEDAVPAVDRGKQVIVVGDEKQLPPTNFFRKLTEAADDEYDEVECPDCQGSGALGASGSCPRCYGSGTVDDPNALAGKESILDVLIARMGNEVSPRHLRVHYRSKHEDLIHFSNHQYYDNGLIVFPSPELEQPGLGVKARYVPEGRYSPGEKRTNPVEAERVVDEVFALMRTRPADESLGVVALSKAQADLIEHLIEERRLAAPDLNERFASGHAESFFVKNLENVQGDERDHIVLSIGYGPSAATGKMLNRFGPLNSENGWRRLNVAVSRARRSMTVAYSFRPSDIVSQTRGAVELRRFLEFAENPRTAIPARQTFDPEAETETPFEESVKRALEARGHNVQPQVGVSGFRIDLAIYSDDRKRFDLAVECDGATYHSAPSARDRDSLRQAILEGLGWRIHRVWSTAWIKDPDGELERIERALDAARSGSALWQPDPASSILPEGSEPTSSVVSTAFPTRPLFDAYEIVRLEPAPSWDDLKSATHDALTSRIVAVVTAEGPVHTELIKERLREAFHAPKVGELGYSNILGAVRRLVNEGRLERVDEHWVALPGQGVRPRQPGQNARRPIGQISPTELQAGIVVTSQAIHGATRQELLIEVARQFGYDRTGDNIQAALEDGCNACVRDGRLVVGSDGLVRPSAGAGEG
jgi:very-short-patch-repair endonuclease